MKKSIIFGATLAIVGLAVTSINAQTQSTTTTSYVQSSTVLGSKIKDSRGQDVGEIKDFVLDRNTGCLAYVVVSTTKSGGTPKTVAAPWTVFSTTSEPRVFTTTIEREKIYSAPVWESTRVEEYSRTDYLTNVYGYYGVAVPQFNARVTISSAPMPTAATAPSVSAAPTAAVSVTPAVGATAKPLPSASAPLQSAAPASSPKATASTTTTEKSKAESPRPKKKSDESTTKKFDKATKTESANEKSDSTSESPSSKPTKKSTKKSAEPETAATPKD